MPATDAAELADAMTADLARALRPAMEELGREMQAEIRQLISVPVQYVSLGSADPRKPVPVGSRPGPGLVQRDARAPGIHYTFAGGKGVRVVRSHKGEPPRKEFGFLYKSMTTETTATDDKIVTVMGSDDSIAGYAARLEEKMSRPHFATVFANVERYAVDRILSRLPQTI